MKADLIKCLSVSEDLRVRKHLKFEEVGEWKPIQFPRHFGNPEARQYLRIFLAFFGRIASAKH
jgi:hypothetical protein